MFSFYLIYKTVFKKGNKMVTKVGNKYNLVVTKDNNGNKDNIMAIEIT